MKQTEKINGLGLGLRFEHFDTILSLKTDIDWFEVIVEDFLSDGPHHEKLSKIRQDYPIVLHSVGLNLGGVDPFDKNHLAKIKEIYDKFQPLWISDHLCWSSHKGLFHHDLLPIPRTKEGLENICGRINFLQDYFQRSLVVENITAYINYKNEEYDEIEFINEIINKTGCNLLLDITNVIINHKNRNLDYEEFFENYPMEKVKQIHLAGGAIDETVIIDSHSEKVGSEDIKVLCDLYKKGFRIPAMIERDSNIPEFSELERELNLIKGKINEVL